MKSGEKAQGNHEAYAAWAFSAKLQQINTKEWLNNDGEIGEVTIRDNKAKKRKREKKKRKKSIKYIFIFLNCLDCVPKQFRLSEVWHYCTTQFLRCRAKLHVYRSQNPSCNPSSFSRLYNAMHVRPLPIPSQNIGKLGNFNVIEYGTKSYQSN